VPVEEAKRICSNDRPSFADLLMSIPEDLETERDPSPLRVPDLPDLREVGFATPMS
jgi:hypothetical protein